MLTRQGRRTENINGLCIESTGVQRFSTNEDVAAQTLESNRETISIVLTNTLGQYVGEFHLSKFSGGTLKMDILLNQMGKGIGTTLYKLVYEWYPSYFQHGIQRVVSRWVSPTLSPEMSAQYCSFMSTFFPLEFKGAISGEREISVKYSTGKKPRVYVDELLDPLPRSRDMHSYILSQSFTGKMLSYWFGAGLQLIQTDIHIGEEIIHTFTVRLG